MVLLQESKEVIKAYELAKKAHEGQIDKGGNPYIWHPIAVANLVLTDDEKVVALLHDIVEDTSITLKDLYEQGFSNHIVEAINCLTKYANEPLNEYLNRVKNNPLAVTVKIADLTHNSDISRIPQPKKKDYARVERYKREIDYLQNPMATEFCAQGLQNIPY